MEETTINIPGDFGEMEEAILLFLYEHPDWDTTTFALLRELKGDLNGATDEEQQQAKKAFEEVQYAVETLRMGNLVRGKRLRANSGDIYYGELKLTPTGEAAAIEQKRRVKKLIIDVPRPQWAKPK